MYFRAPAALLLLAAVLLAPATEAFLAPSGGLARDLARGRPALRSSSCRRSALTGLGMQAEAEPPQGPGEEDKFDMSALNARIEKVKAREANPVLNLQDKISDAVEPVKFEATKLKNQVPDPRSAIPATGLPKWVVPVAAILGFSILTAILQSTLGGGGSGSLSDGSGLATGSL